MVILVLLTALPALAEDPVYFASATLKTRVEATLGVVDPTPTDMLALTKLNCNTLYVPNLTGLEYATNLSELGLVLTQINDDSLLTLSGLTNLTELYLQENHLTDLTPLSGLTKLTRLDIHYNQISDLSPISGLTNLTGFTGDNNPISDLSPFSSLTKMEYLRITDTPLSDLSPLSGLTSLTRLVMWGNQITDINVLSGLPNLEVLSMERNQIIDLSISDMPSLKQLNLWENQISNISKFSGMTNLLYLGLHRNQLSDINGLPGLTNLTELDIRYNQISNLSVSGFPSLRVLTASHNNISQFSISGSPNLRGLHITDNQISDLSFVSGLANLTGVYLSNNQIGDISALTELTNLSSLNLLANPLDCTVNIYIPMIENNNPGISIYYTAPVCIPDIEVSPLVYDFCDVELGTSESFAVTVSNVGNDELSLECLGMQTYNDDFSITISTSIPSVISAGESVNINVTFSPSTEGYSSGALIISSDDPDESVVEVAFSGAGIAPSNRAPIADAGDNIQISSADQIYTVLQGTATDPDGDALTCRWQVILDWSAVGAGGEAYLDLGALAYLTTGNYTLRLEVSDGQLTSSDDMILTIENSPPEAVPGPSSQTVQIGIDPIVVVANVADFDGDPLTYEWLKDGEVLASGSIATVQGGAVVAIPELNLPAGDSRFPLGVHEVELRVNDGVNAPVSALVSVDVTDSTAPSLSPVPSVMILWPPNHELRPVTIQANAYDNGGGAISLAVTVQSSEPPDTDGDGHTISDYYVDSVDSGTGLIELRLRAERSGKGEGRTYTITITATDEGGNQSVATLELLAPHDRRKK